MRTTHPTTAARRRRALRPPVAVTLCIIGMICVWPAGASAQEADSTATLTGRVFSAMTGGALPNVSVSLVAADRGTVTDSTGRFALARVRPGMDTVHVRRIGFAEESVPLHLAAGRVTRVSLLLSQTVLEVAEIDVIVPETEPTGRLAGFTDRKETGHGVFIGPTEIEDRDARRSSDLLRTVPGVRVGPSRAGGTSIEIQRGQRSCRPFVYLDGLPSRDFHIDNLSPQDLLALEIYRGASEIPPQFNFRGSQCAVVVIWTREGRVGERER